MEQPGLTPKQQAIHDWLYAFWLAHGYPPTVRDSDSRRLVTNQARKALDALRERA